MAVKKLRHTKKIAFFKRYYGNNCFYIHNLIGQKLNQKLSSKSDTNVNKRLKM